MSDVSAPANWYDDPEHPTQLRYWDGVAWTDHRAPKPAPAPQPYAAPAYAAPAYAPAAYGAASPYAARVRAPGTPVSPALLMVGGGLLAAAGVGRMVSYLVPYEAFELALVGSIIETIGWVGAFVTFLAAGYPSRHTAARVLTGVLIGLYVLSGIVGLAWSFTPFNAGLAALVGLLGLTIFGVGIPFAIVALRTPGLARNVAALPLVLYGAIVVFGLLTAAANVVAPYSGASATIAGISGIAVIAVGILFLVFGRRPHTA